MPKKNVPQHIGLILDGNRRWARGRGLSTLQGHRRGYERAVEIGDYAFSIGVRYLTLYVFSTENWNRSQAEVRYLMNLLLEMIEYQSKELHKKGIRFKVIGTDRRVPKKIKQAIEVAEKLTEKNKRGVLQAAFNYGGRTELTEAVQDIVRKRIPADKITQKTIDSELYTAGVPDPDLIIRTSGEQRLSGFLLWQAAYAELYFTKKHWPAFTKAEFDKAVDAYLARKRRFGK